MFVCSDFETNPRLDTRRDGLRYQAKKQPLRCSSTWKLVRKHEIAFD